MIAAVLLFGAIAAGVALARRSRCKHVGVTFHGLPSGALVECRQCGALVEFGDVQR